MLIRPGDHPEGSWESTVDRKGNPKPKDSCPFCHGKEIKDRKAPGPKETVIRRKLKPKSTDKRHLFVHFLDSGKHPLGFDLPCCFVKRHDILWTDDRFKRIREMYTEPKTATEAAVTAAATKAAEKSEALQTAISTRAQAVVSFDVIRWSIGNEHIIGRDRYPLQPGRIGFPIKSIDE